MFKRLAAGLLLTMGLSAVALSLVTSPAGADNSPDYTKTAPTKIAPQDPCLTGNGTTATTNPNCFSTQPAVTTAGVHTDAAVGPNASTGNLAFTGTDVIGMVIVAFALIGGGVLVVRFSRRRSTT